MSIPLNFDEITIWLALTSMILLVTSEVLSPYYDKIQVLINKKRLRNVAVAISLLFIASIIIKVANMMFS